MLENIVEKEKVDFSLKEFINRWKNKNNKTMKDMSITELNIVQ